MTPILNTLAEITFKYDGETYALSEGEAAALAGVGLFIGFLGLIILVLMLIIAWKLYKKMGRKGWEGIIPIYDVYVLCREEGVNPWWILTVFVPPVFAIFLVILLVRLGEGFGKSTLFTVMITMFSPIFLAILAFDKQSKWDNSRINYASADFINDKDFTPSKKHSAKKAKSDDEDPWVEGK